MEIREVSKAFGGLWAVKDFSLILKQGGIYGLIGPNGAGKTTIFNLITGTSKVSSGSIYFSGTDITSWSPEKRARIGVTRNFQNLRLFKNLSVLENIKIARHMHLNYTLVEALLYFPSFLRAEKQLCDYCEDLLQIFGLSEYRNHLAAELPYGLQRKLDIVRGIVTGCPLVLLDEPTAGMNSMEAERLRELLVDVWQKYSLTLFVVEHRMPFILNLAHHIVVQDHGVIIAAGSPESIKRDPEVIKAYLGQGDEIA